MVRGITSLALVTVVCTAAYASIVVRASLETLAERCDLAVEGQVVERTVRLDEGGASMWTRFRLKVADTLVGEAAREVTFRVPGGRLGRRSQEIRGVPRMSTGDQVVVFLWKDEAGHYQVLGKAQGVFRIRTDARTGRRVGVNSLSGLVLMGADRQRPQPLRFEVSDLKKRVRDIRRRLEERRAAARARRLKQLRERAELLAELTKGKPGAAR